MKRTVIGLSSPIASASTSRPPHSADDAYRKGDFTLAASIQEECVLRWEKEKRPTAQARKLLALYLYSAQKYDRALDVLEAAHAECQGDTEILENIGVVKRLAGDLEGALEPLLRAHQADPHRANVCDALAHTYASLGHIEEAIRFGRLSLETKDREASTRMPLAAVSDGSPPRFSFERPERNVISFSLWGDNPRYIDGALRNAELVRDIYPGWTCRYYCDDTVSPRVRARLRDLSARVEMRPRPRIFYEGLMWRFEVWSDPAVDRFLVRDCDSVINIRERVAVDEWLQSDRWFHAMRDYYSHTEVLLAGMWGGVGGILPPLQKAWEQFQPRTAPTRTFDQLFLRECVWPTVRQSVLVHDSIFTGCLDSVPFPAVGGLPPRRHVGQDEASISHNRRREDHLSSGRTLEGDFLVTGLDGDAVSHLRRLLEFGGTVALVSEQQFTGVRESMEVQASVMASNTGAASEVRSELRDELLLASMRAMKKTVSTTPGTPVGFFDTTGDPGTLLGLASTEGLKLVCVIRDPRDSASQLRLSTVDRCVEWADAWEEHLRTVASINRVKPGSIEIVRYEDLAPASASKSLDRLGAFLNLPVPVHAGKALPEIDTLKPLPSEFREAIERRNREYLERLQYLPQGAGR